MSGILRWVVASDTRGGRNSPPLILILRGKKRRKALVTFFPPLLAALFFTAATPFPAPDAVFALTLGMSPSNAAASVQPKPSSVQEERSPVQQGRPELRLLIFSDQESVPRDWLGLPNLLQQYGRVVSRFVPQTQDTCDAVWPEDRIRALANELFPAKPPIQAGEEPNHGAQHDAKLKERTYLLAHGGLGCLALDVAALNPPGLSGVVLLNTDPRARFRSEAWKAREGDRAASRQEALSPSRPVTPEALWREELADIDMPVLALYRGDLIPDAPGPAKYAEVTGLLGLEAYRVQRIDGDASQPLEQSMGSKIVRFLQEAASGASLARPERKMLPSGLSFLDVTVGKGSTPRPGQTLDARMRIRLASGKDVSIPDGISVHQLFPLDGTLTKGLGEALLSMHVGGRRKIWIPKSLMTREAPPMERRPPDDRLDGGEDAIIDIVLEGASDDPPPPPRPKWHPSRERMVGDGIRIVEIKEGEGYAAERQSVVTFAADMWGTGDHLARFWPENAPEKGILQDIAEQAKSWLPGITGMKPGGERLIVATSRANFGETGHPGVGPDEDVVFYVRLMHAKPMPRIPVFPELEKLEFKAVDEGVRVAILKQGEGDAPGNDGEAEVHYAAWGRSGRTAILALNTYIQDVPKTLPLGIELRRGWAALIRELRPGGKGIALIKNPGEDFQNVIAPEDELVLQIELLDVISAQEALERRAAQKGRPIRLSEAAARELRIAVEQKSGDPADATPNDQERERALKGKDEEIRP